MSRYSINFIDLFDWNKESDKHYYEMLQGPLFQEEIFVNPPEEKQEAKIVLKHKRKGDGNNNPKIVKRSFLRAHKKGI